jgi:hypothetical protein
VGLEGVYRILKAQNVEDIDNTQGEIVAPMTLKKTDKNVRTTICDGFFSGAANTTRKIVIASLRPQRYHLIDEV